MRTIASVLHFRVRLIFIGLTKSGHFGRQRFHVRASNQNPEHKRQFGKEDWLQPAKRGLVVNRREDREGAERDPAEAGKNQPAAQKPRQKSRAKDQPAERKEPNAPENLIHKNSLSVQLDKKHAERITLGFIEHREEIGAAEKNDCGEVVQGIEKSNRR